MEQHPVPQNVTTFQFRLIGDMTIKQFGYLAGGAIVAYICYKLPLPFFFTWPMTISSVVLGVGLAFVPIEERPMDIWILSFFKSVYSPTQFVWTRAQSDEAKPPPSPRPPVSSSPSPMGLGIVTHPGRSPLEALKEWFTPRPHTTPATTTQSRILSMPQPVHQEDSSYVTPATHSFSVPPPTPVAIPRSPAPHPEVIELQKQLAEMQAHRTKMEQEIAAMRASNEETRKRGNEEKQKAPVVPTPQTTPQATSETAKIMEQPRVNFMTQEVAVKAGVPRLSTYPNVVAGILKDSDGNLLPSVLVTVRDEEGMPLRALKTNKLGQFAASTPLPNGTYIVEIEDPRARFTFDRIKIVLDGSIAPTIEIIAKSQKELTRDRLAKELFGKPL